jgi:homocitrate synthase
MESTMTDNATDLQDLNTIGTVPDSPVDDYDFDDRPGSTGALSLSSSVSSIASSDMDESNAPTIASGITSMSSSGNLASWKIIDTTLREGEQFVNANFNIEMKMKIAQALDDFGVECVSLQYPTRDADAQLSCYASGTADAII